MLPAAVRSIIPHLEANQKTPAAKSRERCCACPAPFRPIAALSKHSGHASSSSPSTAFSPTSTPLALQHKASNIIAVSRALCLLPKGVGGGLHSQQNIWSQTSTSKSQHTPPSVLELSHHQGLPGNTLHLPTNKQQPMRKVIELN